MYELATKPLLTSWATQEIDDKGFDLFERGMSEFQNRVNFWVVRGLLAACQQGGTLLVLHNDLGIFCSCRQKNTS